MAGSAAPVAVAGVDEDLWVCKKCGWTYPNAHPSAKHRRNHRKQCGKLKGIQKNAAPAALEHDAGNGSSDNVSSDDEDRRHHPAPETAHVESVKVEEKPGVTEEPKTAVAVAEAHHDASENVKDELHSANNSLPDEISPEAREEMKKGSFDPRKEPSAGVQDEKPQLVSSEQEPHEEEPQLVPEPQPVVKEDESKKEEPQAVSNEEELQAISERALPTTHNNEQTSGEAFVAPSPSEKLPEIVKEGKPIEAAEPQEARSDSLQQPPESSKDDKAIEASEPSQLSNEQESLKLHDKAGEAAPVEAVANSDSVQGQDSWEQLLDAQLATPQQIVSDTSSSAANNDHLSSTAFPESSFTADKELSAPANGNPFISETEATRDANASASKAAPEEEAPDKKDINLFESPAGGGEASSSTSWKMKEGEGDIKPHIALKALFDEEPRPRPPLPPQQQQRGDSEEQETLIRSGSRRNSNVLQRVIETVKNSPAKFSSSGTGATKKNDELLPPENNRSKSRWSSYICCSQVR